MNNKLDLSLFLDTAVSVISEYFTNYLGMSILLEQKINPEDIPDFTHYQASSIEFRFSDMSEIKIKLIMHPKAMFTIASEILQVNSNELEMLNVEDAMCELLNIISGGIKSKLNTPINGGIKIGIPLFEKSINRVLPQKKLLLGKLELQESTVFVMLST